MHNFMLSSESRRPIVNVVVKVRES